MNLNLNEKINVAVNRLLKMRNLPAFSEDYLPLLESAKEAMREIETHLTKRPLYAAKRTAQKSSISGKRSGRSPRQ